MLTKMRVLFKQCSVTRDAGLSPAELLLLLLAINSECKRLGSELPAYKVSNPPVASALLTKTPLSASALLFRELKG